MSRSGRTWIATILVVAAGIHTFAFFGYAPGDAFLFLKPWYHQLLTSGFSRPVGNYSPPYVYLLWALTWFDGTLWLVVLFKLLSLLGTILVASSAAYLLKVLNRPWELGLLIFALPSVILNSSLLSQADTFWVAPCILAVAASVKGQPSRVAAWSGLAFAVKAQAAWIAPFIIFYLFTSKAKLRDWLAAPTVIALANLPAWILGWPLPYLLTIYFEQATFVHPKGPSVGNSASVWTAFGAISLHAAYSLRWIGLPLTAIAIVGYWLGIPRRLDARQLVLSATLSAALVPLFLPMMHERFFILADVLAFTYALAFPSKRSVFLGVLVQVASAWPVFVWAFRLEPSHLIATPLMIFAVVMYSAELLRGRRHEASYEGVRLGSV